MNIKTLMFLKAASGGQEVKKCEPIYFSAGGMNTPSGTPVKTNTRGTSINTTSADDNSVVVTQEPNYERDAKTSYNGYVFVGFDKLIEWASAGKKMIFDADVDISANPFEVTQLGVIISAKNEEPYIVDNKIHAEFPNVGEYSKNYVEIRCFGCSFTLSNVKLSVE